MKKIALTLVALMTLTTGYAKTEKFQRVVDNTERYDMSFDVRRLAAKLDLTEEQMNAVEAIQQSFNNDMQEAATARRFERRHLVHQAVSPSQQRTLNNKHLKLSLTHNKHLKLSLTNNKHLKLCTNTQQTSEVSSFKSNRESRKVPPIVFRMLC